MAVIFKKTYLSYRNINTLKRTMEHAVGGYQTVLGLKYDKLAYCLCLHVCLVTKTRF
jgi:hypothetical protein